LKTALGPAPGELLGAALSFGDELSALPSAFTLNTVDERLGDDLGELLGEPLSDADAVKLQRPIRPRADSSALKQLGPSLGQELSAALSLGDELSGELGASSPDTVGERLGDELLGKPRNNDDGAELSDPFDLEQKPMLGEKLGPALGETLGAAFPLRVELIA
jgi:hypothetical protein